jgi:hypothetical protein
MTLQGQEPSSYADLLQKVKEITALGKPMALPYLQLLNNAPLKTLASMVSICVLALGLAYAFVGPAGNLERSTESVRVDGT